MKTKSSVAKNWDFWDNYYDVIQFNERYVETYLNIEIYRFQNFAGAESSKCAEADKTKANYIVLYNTYFM